MSGGGGASSAPACPLFSGGGGASSAPACPLFSGGCAAAPAPAFGRRSSPAAGSSFSFGAQAPAAASAFAAPAVPAFGYAQRAFVFASTATPAPAGGGSFSFGATPAPGPSGFDNLRGAILDGVDLGTGNPPYKPVQEREQVVGAPGKVQVYQYCSITTMPQYEAKSFEELRFEDYAKGANKPAATAPFAGPPTAFGAVPSPFGVVPAPAAAPNPFGAANAFGAAPKNAFGAPAAPAMGPFGAPAAAGLPQGWTVKLDPSSGQEYYYNSVTGESKWERPAR